MNRSACSSEAAFVAQPQKQICSRRIYNHRHGNATTYRERGGEDDEPRPPGSERFNRRDAEKKRRGNHDPALEIWKKQPAHGAVIGTRPPLYVSPPSRRILEQRARIKVEQELPSKR